MSSILSLGNIILCTSQDIWDNQDMNDSSIFDSAPQNPERSSDERTWAMLAHLSAPIAMVVSVGWLSFLGPLLVWIFKKDSSPFVHRAAARSFNFNLGMTVLSIIGWICFITIILIPVAIIIWVIAFAVTVWCHINATMRANRGESYNYPFQIPILS